MEKNLVFCENCRNDVSYTITTVPMTGTIKGTEYNYTGKAAHCINCGSRLYTPDINDANLKALYDEYRTQITLFPWNIF